MCSVTAAGDKRVTKMIRQHLQSKDPTVAETALKALSGALLQLDVHKECYLPSRDELEHDDLEVGMTFRFSTSSHTVCYSQLLSFSCHHCYGTACILGVRCW